MSFGSLLVHTVNILRATRGTPTPTPDGSYTESWETISSNVPCRVRPLSGEELYMLQTLHSSITHKVYMSTAPHQGDRLVWGARTLEVLAVLDVHGYAGVHHYQVACGESTEYP